MAEVNSKTLFATLVQRIKDKPDLQVRVGNHVRAKSGHNTLVNYHNNGASEEDKCELYKEILRAIMSGKPEALAGPVANGQAAEPPNVALEVVPAPQAAPATTAAVPVATDKDSLTVQLATSFATQAEAIKQLIGALGATPKAAAVDEAQVRAIAEKIVEDALVQLNQTLSDEVDRKSAELEDSIGKRFSSYIQSLPPRDVILLRKWDGTEKELTGLRHKQFGTVLRFITARTSNGFPVPLWTWGAPGAGKTHLGKQLAEALDVPYYPIPLGPTSTEGRLLGFPNLATGAFVEGMIFKAYRDGGLTLLDEIDVADPGVLVALNSLTSNGCYRFPNGELVQRNKDWHCIASANTIGKGAMGGFTRNKLDAATLDRFSKLKLDYDRDLEVALCGNSKWCDYVWKVREYVETHCANSIYITPRASIKGAALLANEVDADTVAQSELFALCSEDVKATIITNVGKFAP